MIGPLAVAALGLLLERPMHPYEMVQLLLARSEDRLIKVRPGSLYHAVDRLHSDGLVRPVGTERAGNRPERTTYAITSEGVDALGEWVRHALSTAEPEFPRFPLALGEAHNLSRTEVVTRLRRRLAALHGQDAELAAGEQVVAGKSLDERFWLDLPYTRALLAAEIDHLDPARAAHRVRGPALAGSSGPRLLRSEMTDIKPWPALWSLIIGFFMILIDTTIVSVANPAILKGLNTDINSVIWVTSAYLLAFAVPLLVTGRLGDRFGPKNIYLIGLVIFTLASACVRVLRHHRRAHRRPCRAGPRRRAHVPADHGGHHPHLPARAPRRRPSASGARPRASRRSWARSSAACSSTASAGSGSSSSTCRSASSPSCSPCGTCRCCRRIRTGSTSSACCCPASGLFLRRLRPAGGPDLRLGRHHRTDHRVGPHHHGRRAARAVRRASRPSRSGSRSCRCTSSATATSPWRTS